MERNIGAVSERGDRKVLLVDDDQSLLRVLAIRLGHEGFQVEATDNARSALAALPSFRPHVVVTDMKDNTYYSKVHLLYEDSEYSIDSRPSDAIALALRTNAPIFANEDVIRKQASEELDQWLENLKPEDFGKYET